MLFIIIIVSQASDISLMLFIAHLGAAAKAAALDMALHYDATAGRGILISVGRAPVRAFN